MGVTSRDMNFVLPASPATAQISSGSLAPAPICLPEYWPDVSLPWYVPHAPQCSDEPEPTRRADTQHSGVAMTPQSCLQICLVMTMT